MRARCQSSYISPPTQPPSHSIPPPSLAALCTKNARGDSRTMRLHTFLTPCLAALALGHAIRDHAPDLAERADTVPQATPTGTFCANGGEGTPSLPSPAQVTSALAGCQGVTATGVTRNDIVDGLPCKPFTLIFARGTTETGNIGSIVGPPFVLALEKAFGASNVAVQGVNNYPAISQDYCAGGSLTGSQNLAQVCACILTSET